MGHQKKTRNAERLFIGAPVELGGKWGKTLDVSAGGCGIELSAPIQPNRMVHGQIVLGGSSYNFAGELVWVRGGLKYSRAGIRFHRVDGDLLSAAGAQYQARAPGSGTAAH